MTKLSPGCSTAWKRPSRSTTHACCCGTTRIALMTTINATMNSTIVTAEEPIPMSNPCVDMLNAGVTKRCSGRAVGDDERRAPHADDHHRIAARHVGACRLGLPQRASIRDAGGAVRVPRLDAYRLADVERRILWCCRVLASPAMRKEHAHDGNETGDDELDLERRTQECR